MLISCSNKEFNVLINTAITSHYLQAKNQIKDLLQLEHVFLLVDPLIANFPFEIFSIFKPNTSMNNSYG